MTRFIEPYSKVPPRTIIEAMGGDTRTNTVPHVNSIKGTISIKTLLLLCELSKLDTGLRVGVQLVKSNHPKSTVMTKVIATPVHDDLFGGKTPHHSDEPNDDPHGLKQKQRDYRVLLNLIKDKNISDENVAIALRKVSIYGINSNQVQVINDTVKKLRPDLKIEESEDE